MPAAAKEATTAVESQGQKEVDRVGAAATVARVVELTDVSLHRLVVEPSASVDSILSNDCTLEIDPRSYSYVFDEKAGRIRVVVGVNVRVVRQEPAVAKRAKAASSTELLRIEVDYSLGYDLKVPPPPEELRDTLFDCFAEVNGTYNAWPYLREIVQDVTGRLGIPPITLPVFRVPRPPVTAQTSGAPKPTK
ncbi:MAG TPA: hypothetical protein VGG39_37145 [Polyangiaceae bacterium]